MSRPESVIRADEIKVIHYILLDGRFVQLQTQSSHRGAIHPSLLGLVFPVETLSSVLY